jgi:hypothetical protein
VKSIIETSVVKIEEPIAIKPGTEDEKMGLNELSITGGIVNAYNALRKAESFKGERVLEPVSVKPDQKGNKKGKN